MYHVLVLLWNDMQCASVESGLSIWLLQTVVLRSCHLHIQTATDKFNIILTAFWLLNIIEYHTGSESFV